MVDGVLLATAARCAPSARGTSALAWSDPPRRGSAGCRSARGTPRDRARGGPAPRSMHRPELVLQVRALLARVEHQRQIDAPRSPDRSSARSSISASPDFMSTRAGAVEPIPSIRGGPSCAVRTTSRCPASAIFGPPVPRVDLHDERVAVAAHRRGERAAAEPLGHRVSSSSCSSPDGRRDGAQPEQRLREIGRRPPRPRRRALTPAPRSRAAPRSGDTLGSVASLRLPMISAQGTDELTCGEASWAACRGSPRCARGTWPRYSTTSGARDVEDRRRRGEHDAGADAPPLPRPRRPPR